MLSPTLPPLQERLDRGWEVCFVCNGLVMAPTGHSTYECVSCGRSFVRHASRVNSPGAFAHRIAQQNAEWAAKRAACTGEVIPFD